MMGLSGTGDRISTILKDVSTQYWIVIRLKQSLLSC